MAPEPVAGKLSPAIGPAGASRPLPPSGKLAASGAFTALVASDLTWTLLPGEPPSSRTLQDWAAGAVAVKLKKKRVAA